MNGATTKATNRQLRKAFGTEALDHIAGLNVRLEAAELQIRALDARINAERTHRLEMAREQRAYVDGKARESWLAAHDALEAFARRPWYRRWWWVVSGR